MPELAYRRLDDDEIRKALEDLPGWAVDGDSVAKTYSFDRYKDGVVFASAVGYLADRLNHHPDMLVGYGKVSVRLSTHDVGGISPFDIELARRIDALNSA